MNNRRDFIDGMKLIERLHTQLYGAVESFTFIPGINGVQVCLLRIKLAIDGFKVANTENLSDDNASGTSQNEDGGIATDAPNESSAIARIVKNHSFGT